MRPFKIVLCGDEVGAGAVGDEVGAGAIACGRDFRCLAYDTSHPSNASQRRVFECSGASILSVLCFFHFFWAFYEFFFFLLFLRIEMLKEQIWHCTILFLILLRRTGLVLFLFLC